MISSDDYLVQWLLDTGMVDQAGVDSATAVAASDRLGIGEAFVAAGVLSDRDVAVARAGLCECPFVDLEHYEISINNASLIPRSAAETLGVFTLFVIDGVATVGMTDPLNLKAIDQARASLKAEIEPVLCIPGQLQELIAKAYSLVSTSSGARREPREHISDDLVTGEEPIVAAVNHIIASALEDDASDVHISPTEHEIQLRYRIDGHLQGRQGPPLSAHPAIVQRLKVMAKLDLTQTRRPQDGKFRFEHHNHRCEVRLSTIPTVCGENVVMRLLRPHGAILDFDTLGIPTQAVQSLNDILTHPHGMLLVTGPTGSGKTSTLYTAVKRLNTPDRNVVTIEDPVEIRMHGVRQVQTNADIGLTFAAALRSILRQDPDVVLLGEVRDAETALISTQASLTGHLVLSTLHTNDAAGSIARLKDLGVPPFVINSALLAVIAQRLVRRLCKDCSRPHTPDETLLRRFGLKDGGEFRRGAGCAACGTSGYRGRIGIYELFRMDSQAAAMIDNDATTQELNAYMFSRSNMPKGSYGPMWLDGVTKARMGITSLEEVGHAVASVDVEAMVDAAPEMLREAA
ncbi:MAG: type II/IV secretion system protein [Phycisphaerales bacterium]|nr:type II/IV secretion system protein [Phycisphaerales bacterium]